MSELPITLWLPLPLSNNNTGQSRHWSAAYKDKATFANTLTNLKLKGTPPPYKQRVTVTRILGKGERLWDADSVLRGNAKQLIDAMVDAGFFVDDSPKHITEVFGKQDDQKRFLGPAIKVEVERVDAN